MPTLRYLDLVGQNEFRGSLHLPQLQYRRVGSQSPRGAAHANGAVWTCNAPMIDHRLRCPVFDMPAFYAWAVPTLRYLDLIGRNEVDVSLRLPDL